MLFSRCWLCKHRSIRLKPIADFATSVEVFAVPIFLYAPDLRPNYANFSLIRSLSDDASDVASTLATNGWLLLQFEVLAHMVRPFDPISSHKATANKSDCHHQYWHESE